MSPFFTTTICAPKGLEGRYDGDLRNGKVDGNGVAWQRNEEMNGFDRVEGFFIAGEPAGEIKISSSEGYIFTGQYFGDEDHAEGRLETPEGWIVQGEIKDGAAVGSALVFYETEDGEMYFGGAENNKRHGFGTLISSDETSYIGEFKEGSARLELASQSWFVDFRWVSDVSTCGTELRFS